MLQAACNHVGFQFELAIFTLLEAKMQANSEPDELVVDPECEDCGEIMHRYNEDETIETKDTALDEDGEMWQAWKASDCKLATFHACGNCKMLKCAHNKCGHQMLFVGHMGFSVDGNQHMRNAKTGTKAELGHDAICKDRSQPRFDVTDLGKYKFRVNEWMPCGPDGTYKHFWYCEECKTELGFSEK